MLLERWTVSYVSQFLLQSFLFINLFVIFPCCTFRKSWMIQTVHGYLSPQKVILMYLENYCGTGWTS